MAARVNARVLLWPLNSLPAERFARLGVRLALMAQPITREAFVELLHDYVRDALQQRLQDKHSSHFALCVCGLRGRVTLAWLMRTALSLCALQAAHQLRPAASPACARGKGAASARSPSAPDLTLAPGGRLPSRRSRSTCRWSTTSRTSSCC